MNGGHRSAAWPRVGAHLGVLMVVGALWSVPLLRASAAPGAARPLVAAEIPAANPRQATHSTAMASAAPVLAIAAAPAFQLLPIPAAQRPGHHAVAPKAPAKNGTPTNGWGNDISWPQCDGNYPGAHDVGTVGITGGRPFTSNPCLDSQWGWAKASRFTGGAQVYLNLEVDGTSNGPHLCAADDHGCRAYDYGYITALDSMARAGAHGVRPDYWWLDVEVGNNWSDVHPDWNALTVQGAIDAFLQRGYPVGIYSSVDQWAQIVPGDYHPGVPTWLAVVGDAASVGILCGQQHSLTGGPVLMVQYDDHGFDQDFVCPAGTGAFADARTRILKR